MLDTRLFISVATVVTMAMVSAPQAASERDFKCYILDLNGSPELVLFQTKRALPEWIGGDSVSLTVLPESVQPRASRVVECTLSEREFRDPSARQLDDNSPR
jgi:hypothetical protein